MIQSKDSILVLYGFEKLEVGYCGDSKSSEFGIVLYGLKTQLNYFSMCVY